MTTISNRIVVHPTTKEAKAGCDYTLLCHYTLLGQSFPGFCELPLLCVRRYREKVSRYNGRWVCGFGNRETRSDVETSDRRQYLAADFCEQLSDLIIHLLAGLCFQIEPDERFSIRCSYIEPPIIKLRRITVEMTDLFRD